jgi:CheY-like chemotaxis protein/anti-sigma regulatory factor (Ser/Thr protein kinase)
MICAIAPDVPETVVGDRLRLRQIVVNLVANAIKFTEVGEIATEVQVDAAGGDDVVLHFTVSDTGIGIPQGKHESIFGAFAQADASTTRKYGGTGLGLTISSRLVSLMGGRMWLESEPGKGSRFHFTAKFQKVSGQAGAHNRSELALLSGQSVLIADGREKTRRSLTETAVRWGLSPAVASTGEEALDILLRAAESAKPYGLLWCDADLTGVELIVRDPRLAGLHCILLFAGAQPADALRFPRLGVAALLRKPVRESELRAATIRALAQPAAPPEAGIPLPPPQASATRLRVLLAEDNVVNQRVGRRLLERLGHSVVVAGDGREAIRAVEEQDFDVIFMDVQMPEIDGIEAVAEIRRSERTSGKHRKIIAMTAHAMKGDRERCLEAGMDGYLSKPIRVDELTALLAGIEAPVAAD